VLTLENRNPVLLTAYADSNGSTSSDDVQNDPTALRALTERAPTRGVVTRAGISYAEVAYPLSATDAVLLRSSLRSQLDTVGVVRRRVFLAGGLAIAFAIVLGYVGASHFGRRIRRLERAVERIAGGDFEEAVVDAGSDELGQLARAFERMRLQLAHLDRARGEFIANASHELRTPLFSLGGFLELLDDPELEDATRLEFLAQAREQVTRLTKLATELLDLSRLDAGRLSVAREAVDLAEITEELGAEFSARARAIGHPLEVVADGAVAAHGDAERVLQIGRVLVENALVHTPADTTVRVSSARDGGRATLTVANDGPEIPRDAQHQIFERFYRLDGARASGSGLGLAIARELAELMGGRIELDSQNGWTLFTLVLGADVGDREGAAAFV
jgi:signal transduction histidine kinase